MVPKNALYSVNASGKAIVHHIYLFFPFFYSFPSISLSLCLLPFLRSPFLDLLVPGVGSPSFILFYSLGLVLCSLPMAPLGVFKFHW
jgi:hypothetical protein